MNKNNRCPMCRHEGVETVPPLNSNNLSLLACGERLDPLQTMQRIPISPHIVDVINTHNLANDYFSTPMTNHTSPLIGPIPISSTFIAFENCFANQSALIIIDHINTPTRFAPTPPSLIKTSSIDLHNTQDYIRFIGIRADFAFYHCMPLPPHSILYAYTPPHYTVGDYPLMYIIPFHDSRRLSVIMDNFLSFGFVGNDYNT